uniref:HTH-type transcriptional regulator LrpA n=1 Tax=Thermosporothrix sp. COM3 TaxID=2490863 RepID=A0A455SML4_9CHLR|nr:HTH-type transcriptional regulator LrpA [Thermosporothrix sp. COM3]
MIQLDAVDKAILRELRENSRLSIRKLAEKVHMTAPAVNERVRRLEEQGIITRYTIQIDRSKLASAGQMMAFVQVMVESSDHRSFLRFAQNCAEIIEYYRIAGDACYLLKIQAPDTTALDEFLDRLLRYGNYRLNLVISGSVKEMEPID